MDAHLWKIYHLVEPLHVQKKKGEAPEDLKRSQHRGDDVADRVDLGHRGQRDLERPGKTQDHIF